MKYEKSGREILSKRTEKEDFPRGPGVKTQLPVQGAWMPSLAGEQQQQKKPNIKMKFQSEIENEGLAGKNTVGGGDSGGAGERRAWTLVPRLWTDPVGDRGSVCSERRTLEASEASGGLAFQQARDRTIAAS